MPAPTTPSKATPKPRQILKIDLGEAKPRLQAWCKTQNTTPSAALRQQIEKLLSASPATPANAAEMPGDPEPRTKRRELKLTRSEDHYIKTQAAAAGCNAQQWLLGLIRTQLTGQPRVMGAEREALVLSNYQLMALGRNLNQIAKALNANLDRQTVEATQISELETTIKQHVGVVRALLDRSAGRWKLQ